MDPAYVGLGGNVGDVAATFDRAYAALAALPGVRAVRRSSTWRSTPVGPVPDQPTFWNACAELLFTEEPAPPALLGSLLEIERAAGRDRPHEQPQGPRPLDLDLLVWGPRQIHTETVILPHPRLARRAFALAPLVELAGPELYIPGAGRAGDLLATVLADPTQGLRKV